MSHQCIKCSALYPEMVMECGCGSKAFLFLKRDITLPEAVRVELLEQVEAQDSSEHIELGIEDLGKYDIDIGMLLGDQKVCEQEEGKYTINLARCLRK